MDLFEQIEKEPNNLLGRDGTVHYWGAVVPKSESERYFQSLLSEIVWRHDEAVIFGRRIVIKREVAWYADEPFAYTYSKTTKTALPWIPVLTELKEVVEDVSGERYNSCLANLYHSGDEGMAWHSDGEKELKKNGAIASLSLGAERKFKFKHKQTKQTVSQLLEQGSLLVMKGQTQTHWLHCLPLTKVVRTARINLTFRTIDCE